MNDFGSEYVVFSVSALEEMFNTIWKNTGTITNVALTILFVSVSIYSVVRIIRYFTDR